MAKFSVDQIIQATGGELAAGKKALTVDGVATDSRQVRPGSLFVAIRGERLDGHDFVREAFARGAAAALVSHKLVMVNAPGKTLVAVKDTTAALLNLAAFHRGRMKSLKLAGVTGSNGKTTVKDMIAGALSGKFNTLKTEGNLNNQIGLPMTLLGLTPAHRAAVVEMGINKPGEMAPLAAAARPDVGVITNIGHAHMAGLKSLVIVRKEKAAMLDHLAEGGIAVLNASDPGSAPIIKKLKGRPMITFGLGGMGDVTVAGASLSKNLLGRTVILRHGGRETAIELKMIGAGAAVNAAAAFAVGLAMGLSPAKIAKGIASVLPAKRRMAISRLPNGAFVIDDSYNANPDSLASALDTLSEMGAQTRLLALGDMLELGAHAEAAHRKAAWLAKAAGVSHLLAFGPLASLAAVEAKKLGISAAVFKTHGALAKNAIKRLRPGAALLVKGSRGMEMDKAAEQVLAGAGER